MSDLELYFGMVYPQAGCDEAGRGCLAGPVVAAAVILKKDFRIQGLDDSKKINPQKRIELRETILEYAEAWAVAMVDNHEIDKINILNASFLAMHRALDQLAVKPLLIAVDGNRFKEYQNIPHVCIVKGDAKYANIAAASILAKTHRDAFMEQIHEEFPQYGWKKNKGYPTPEHKLAIHQYGLSKYHRKTFSATIQLKMF